MPKRTDAEWRELDERLARELMGLHKWGELPEDARRAYWEIIDEEPDEYWLVHNERQWWSLDESGCPDGEEWLSKWQPHLDVTQAMDVLEALSQKGINYSITRFAKHEIIVQLWGYLRGRFCVRRQTGKIVRRTICLAAERWANAQKEVQDDLDEAKATLEAVYIMDDEDSDFACVSTRDDETLAEGLRALDEGEEPFAHFPGVMPAVNGDELRATLSSCED